MKRRTSSKIIPGQLIGKDFYCDQLDSAVEVIEESLVRVQNQLRFSTQGVKIRRWDNSAELRIQASELEEIEEFSCSLTPRYVKLLNPGKYHLSEEIVESAEGKIVIGRNTKWSVVSDLPDTLIIELKGWNSLEVLKRDVIPWQAINWEVGDRYCFANCKSSLIDVLKRENDLTLIKRSWTQKATWCKQSELDLLAQHISHYLGNFSLEIQRERDERQKNSKNQTGSLYQYTKQVNGICYPKIHEERKRNNDSHWYWGYSYVEKVKGKWRDRSASIPRGKLNEVRLALIANKPYTEILREILDKD